MLVNRVGSMVIHCYETADITMVRIVIKIRDARGM